MADYYYQNNFLLKLDICYEMTIAGFLYHHFHPESENNYVKMKFAQVFVISCIVIGRLILYKNNFSLKLDICYL